MRSKQHQEGRDLVTFIVCLDYSYPAASDSVSPPVIGGAVAAGVVVVIVTLVLVLVIVRLLKRRQKEVTATGELYTVLFNYPVYLPLFIYLTASCY